MKSDSRIIISINKQFFSDNDEIRIHVWFNHKFYSKAYLIVKSPSGREVDSAILRTDSETTETFALTCGGPKMLESGYYTIQVQCDEAISETMFEYYHSQNHHYFDWKSFMR